MKARFIVRAKCKSLRCLRLKYEAAVSKRDLPCDIPVLWLVGHCGKKRVGLYGACEFGPGSSEHQCLPEHVSTHMK